jgi:HEAT repeat protein
VSPARWAYLVPLLLVVASAGCASTTVPTVAESPTSRPTIDALIDALTSPDPQERIRAAEALRMMGPAAADTAPALVRAMDGQVLARVVYQHGFRGTPQSAAADALVRIGPAAAPALLVGLKNGSPSVLANCLFVAARARLDDPALTAALLELRRHPDPHVRAGVITALRPVSNRDVLAATLEALRDDSEAVRVAAVSRIRPPRDEPQRTDDPDVLRDFDKQKAAEALIARLADDRSALVRCSAAETLGVMQNVSAIKPLTNTMADEDALIAAIAARALGEIDNAQAVPPLVAALDAETRDSVLPAIADSLGKLKNPLATRALVSKLAHPTGTVRWHAAAALGGIRDRRAVLALVPLLGDPARDVRNGAAHALGLMGDTRAVEPLMAATRAGDTPSAEWALGELNDPRAIDVLVESLFRKGKEQTGDALARIRHPRVVVVLCEREPLEQSNDGRFRARRVVSTFAGRDFSFNPDEMAAWWRENESVYRAAAAATD